jgi:hypothetical protein
VIFQPVNRGKASLNALTKAKQLDLGDVTRPWRQAADQVHYRAQFGLGLIFDSVLGVEKNHSEASEWLRKAAKNWLRKAADEVDVDVEAQFNLSVAYGQGRGLS